MEARVDITAPLINEVSDRPLTTTVSDRDSNGMRGESCPMSALESRRVGESCRLDMHRLVHIHAHMHVHINVRMQLCRHLQRHRARGRAFMSASDFTQRSPRPLFSPRAGCGLGGHGIGGDSRLPFPVQLHPEIHEAVRLWEFRLCGLERDGSQRRSARACVSPSSCACLHAGCCARMYARMDAKMHGVLMRS